jgi:hypothetical protein
VNRWISKHRKISDNFSIRQEMLTSLGVIISGTIFGIIAKATDSTTLIGDIGTDLSIWVLLGTVIAAYSHQPISAGINTMLFFLGLLAGYYTYGQFMLNFFPTSYFFGWFVVALVSLPCGFVIWFSRSSDLLGAIITAVPAGIIFAWSYPAFYTYNIVLILGVVYGILLCALLPHGWKMKCAAIVLSLAVAFIIESLNLLSMLPF